MYGARRPVAGKRASVGGLMKIDGAAADGAQATGARCACWVAVLGARHPSSGCPANTPAPAISGGCVKRPGQPLAR